MHVRMIGTDPFETDSPSETGAFAEWPHQSGQSPLPIVGTTEQGERHYGHEREADPHVERAHQ
jgi:hypothetical protein